MKAVIAENSIKALNNVKLTSKIKLRETHQKLSVIAVTSAKQCIDTNRAYILMTAPFSSGHELTVYHNGKNIGGAELSYCASYLDRIDNHEPEHYKGVGTALVELTARLALQSGYTSLRLYAVDSSSLFHFKMGSRFHNEDENIDLKEMITYPSQNDPMIFGDMQLHFAQASSGKDSPRLISQILKTEVAHLKI